MLRSGVGREMSLIGLQVLPHRVMRCTMYHNQSPTIHSILTPDWPLWGRIWKLQVRPDFTHSDSQAWFVLMTRYPHGPMITSLFNNPHIAPSLLVPPSISFVLLANLFLLFIQSVTVQGSATMASRNLKPSSVQGFDTANMNDKMQSSTLKVGDLFCLHL